LRSDLGDEHPSIAEPVELFDRTPPKVKLRCKAIGGAKLRCTIRSNERATALMTLKLGGTAKKTVRLKPGRNKRFTIRAQATGRGKAQGRRQRPEQEHHAQARARAGSLNSELATVVVAVLAAPFEHIVHIGARLGIRDVARGIEVVHATGLGHPLV
jgi:hypothetical protein